MKVLFYSWEFPPNGTGVAGYVAAMSRALVQHGHEAIIVTGRAEGRPEREEGSCGLVLRCYDRKDVGRVHVARAVARIARDEAVDWIEGADHLGEAAALLREKDRPPVIVKAHSSRPIRIARESDVLHVWQRGTMALAMARDLRGVLAERAALMRSDMLLTPSQRMRAELAAQGLRPEGSIRMVPNPVSVVPEGSTPGPSPSLLFVGRISIGKGIQFLPALLSRLTKQRPDLVLEVAGPDSYARGLGSLRSWLERRCGPLGRHLRFLGVLGPEALDAAYRRAWVVVCPSRWDNFPNAVLDAMVRGVPVVASPHGGMPEQLEGTGCPIADPASRAFAEAVAALLADADLRRRCGGAARQRALSAYHPLTIVPCYLKTVAASLGL